MSKYTPEQAGRALAEWANTRERLLDHLRGVPEGIDLDTGVRSLERRLRRRIRKLVVDGYEPGRVGDLYPNPDDLVREVLRLRQEGRVSEAAVLSKTIREIRLLGVVAWRMTGRRSRDPLQVVADRRHKGNCQECQSQILEGELIWWDRDRGAVWHLSCGVFSESTRATERHSGREDGLEGAPSYVGHPEAPW